MSRVGDGKEREREEQKHGQRSKREREEGGESLSGCQPLSFSPLTTEVRSVIIG